MKYSLWLRVAGCALLAWWTVKSGFASRWIFLDFVNLAFHEAGHVFFGFLGSTVHYLGGTFGQLLVPSILVAYFLLWQGRPLGAACCVWWLGQSFCNVATYMADARELALPLVGGGDHDWNELFFRFGVLDEPSVVRISGITHAVGLLFLFAGLGWTAWFALPTGDRLRWRDRLADRYPWIAPALGD